MATTTQASVPRLSGQDSLDSGPRQIRWVILWATFGTISLAVVAQGWIRWILSDEFKPVVTGSDAFGGWKLLWLRGIQVLMPAIAVYVIWRFLLRPLLRERTLTLDGMLIIAIITGWFYDPATINYVKFTSLYNGHFLNWGSWANFIPGWHSPNGQNFPEPVLFMGSAYVVWCFLFTLLGGAVFRALRTRRPKMSNVALFGILFLLLAIADLVIEPLVFVVPELWTYNHTIGWLTLWKGTTHQFPIYESIIVAPPVLVWVAIRWFRDDRGRSFVEKGVDDLRISTRSRRIVTFLAVTGFAHLGFLAFVVPWNALSLKADTYADFPSYLRNGICGEGTDYACPSKYVPIPSKSSLHIKPDDPDLPESVRGRSGPRS